ncbi:hypothetical protein J8F10_37415 [Gemmata sp. G18]|uniref:SPOR domain-containing protein n=1 Tax=Gemmata palustris TaxID=2822762 RepID=A0ABS5C655_9BACT|nr:hypothetical protein [Gemmata palustris]MBP3960935.1 hypothetical protein [Gemmata palustris]
MDADEEYEELIERRRFARQRKARRTAVLGMVALLVLSVATVVVVIVATSGRDATHSKRVPTTDREWASHKDLAAHLRQQGVPVEFATASVVDRPDRPAAHFWIGDGRAGTRVVVYLCKDAARAEEAAGTIEDGFTVGRFAIGSFDSTAEARATTKKIRGVLKG